MGSNGSYDLVVVGFGGAALSAAVTYIETAAAEGREARIAMLERATKEERGGATRWTTAGMRVTEDWKLDPLWVGTVQDVSEGLADLQYTQTFEREVPNTCAFLMEHGVELNWNRMPLAGALQGSASPNGGGHAIVEALAAVVEAHPGVDVLYETEGVRLTSTEDGRVNGVVARGPDGLLRTMHGDAVVLACGGFEGNYEMLTQYCGERASGLKKLAPGTQYNKGDGIRMVLEIGGDTAGQFDGMHAELVDVRSSRADPVLYGHTWTIAVNGDGTRFYDEGATSMGESFELIAYEVWRNQDQTAFLITDEDVMTRDILTRFYDTDVPPAKANTIRELAAQLGLDPDALQQTVDEFNAACNDNEFDPSVYDGKATDGIEPPKSNWANPISHPPYYGWPVSAAICFTYGGVKTDDDARVLAKNGAPIPACTPRASSSGSSTTSTRPPPRSSRRSRSGAWPAPTPPATPQRRPPPSGAPGPARTPGPPTTPSINQPVDDRDMTDIATRTSPRFADLTVGDELTPLVRGPMTPVHLMRWSATIENWHRIHYDEPFATGHEGLPGLLVNGSWKQHFLVQMLREWLGPEGWLLRAGFQFRGMDVVGSTLTAWGRVTELEERGDLGFVGCEIGIRNQDGEESTPGTAVGVLPIEPGGHVPYPFPPELAA